VAWIQVLLAVVWIGHTASAAYSAPREDAEFGSLIAVLLIVGICVAATVAASLVWAARAIGHGASVGGVIVLEVVGLALSLFAHQETSTFGRVWATAAASTCVVEGLVVSAIGWRRRRSAA
jgi:hypothetical protein